MASEMAVVESERVSGMVNEMISELEKASGMPSEMKLIGHVCFKEIPVV